MSTSGLPLTRSAPYRRRRVAEAAHSVEWQNLPGSWLGTLNGQIAGTITRPRLRYRVVDWSGETVGSFVRLSSAKLSVEPGGLLERRETLYRRSARGEAVIAGVVGSIVVALGAGAGVALINAPL